jgi:DNA-binding NarL/FixJ family response regulator
MGQRLGVSVIARDPVSRAGIAQQLPPCPGVDLVDDGASVSVVVADRLDEDAQRIIRSLTRTTSAGVVAIIAALDDSAVLSCTDGGASGVLRGDDAADDRLVHLILSAAHGDGSIPPDLLGRLFNQLGGLQHLVPEQRGLTCLTQREIEVLRLVADGFDTCEIAMKLHYSERTIKNILHDVTVRFGLRNRTHAVAYALREGLI